MDGKVSPDRYSRQHNGTEHFARVVLAAPLASATSGRLVFASSAARLTLSGDPALADLYKARFEGDIPGVGVQEGIVTIQYRHDWLLDLPRPSAALTLNGSIPWEIEFRRGVSRFTADLRQIPLRSLDFASSSQVRVTLPRPAGIAYIHFGGSASDVAIYRPSGVAVHFNLHGSGARLALDDHYLSAAPDGLRWHSSDDLGGSARYEISVSGSVSVFTIDTR